MPEPWKRYTYTTTERNVRRAKMSSGSTFKHHGALMRVVSVGQIYQKGKEDLIDVIAECVEEGRPKKKRRTLIN